LPLHLYLLSLLPSLSTFPSSLSYSSLSSSPHPLPQVRQDSWACFLVSSGAIRTPQRQAVEDREDEEEPVLVSASYNWMLSTISLYLKEVWILIRGDGNQDRSDSGAACIEEKEKDMDTTSSPSYSRADLCEVM
jgi:hypothetical protein